MLTRTRAIGALALLGAWASLTSSASAQEPPDLGEAATRARAGDTEGALAALDALAEELRESAAARYLRGRLLETRARRVSRARALAVDAFAALEGLPPSLARDASSRRARLLAREGRCAEAEVILAGLESLSALERALRAECALARGELTTARAMLAREAAVDARDVDSVALRFSLAEAEARDGERAVAEATLRAILLERPEHPDVARIEEAYERLSGRALSFTTDERLARAERFGRVRMHRQAVREIDRIPASRDREVQRRVLHARGVALFNSRHAYAEAATVLTRAARLGGPHALDDEFMAARARSRAGDDARAIREYRAFARRHSGHARAAQAEYLAAWLGMRLGQRSAPRAMERYLARAGRGGLAREARWHLALHAFRGRRFRDAATRFGEYAATGTDALTRGRGLYWRARGLDEAGDDRQARSVYQSVIAEFPLHWYALLAHQRLVAMGTDGGGGEIPPPLPPARAATETGSATPLSVSDLPLEVRWLAALGLAADARDALRPHETALRRTHGALALSAILYELGDPGRASRLAAQADELSRSASGDGAHAWALAYPRAYEAEVSAAARAQGLDPELLWGIMRQESGYDPDALSYADAMGLLQLLPSTGERVAAGLGVPFRREMLFEPAWNARLGAAYVATQIRAHGVPLCFAAYNAGGHRVRAWLARTGEVDLDLFVEEIPFDQTRNYVRRVTSHVAHYLHAAHPDAGWPALDLPERVGPRPEAPDDGDRDEPLQDEDEDEDAE